MRIAGIALILIVLGAVGWRYFSSQGAAPRPNPPALVVLYQVTTKPIKQTLNALGTTEALQAVTLSSTITERIKELPLREGERVTQGTVLAVLENAEELAQQKIAEIELAEHRREYARIVDLVQAKTIPSSELDRLKSLIDGAAARLNEVNANLAERTLTAPFDGVVGLRKLSVGALARPGDVIATLDSIDQLLVDFNVAERHLASLKANKKITASSVAYPGLEFEGYIQTISPRVDKASRSVTARAVIDNSNYQLQPGMLLDIAILKAKRNAMIVPEEAVFMRGESHLVFRINADNIAEEREVSIGIREQGSVEITQGLQEGDQIVAKGLLKVKPGQPVKAHTENWRDQVGSEAANQSETATKKGKETASDKALLNTANRGLS